MSTVVRTRECYPEVAAEDISRMLGIKAEPGPAEHEKCPGGYRQPGLLGGWHCPCPCHQTPADHEVAYEPPPDVGVTRRPVRARVVRRRAAPKGL